MTGAARGIGAATVREFARRGYAVCINYLTNSNEAAALAAAIQKNGGKAIAVRADVAREDDVAALFREVDHVLGPPTVLVNNAAISAGRHLLVDTDAARLRQVIEVNLIGSLLCIKAATQRMALSRGGSGGAIVNLSSTVTRTGGFHLTPYVAAKAGIEGLTKALASELAADGIRVNALRPGIIATEDADNHSAQSERTASIPMGRPGTPEEVAQAVAWLASDEASYVTGTVLDVAGGR